MDLKETIENALYSMGKFTTDECSEMAKNLQFAIGQEVGQVDAIVKCLNDYRLHNQHIDGDEMSGLPLVDALTPDNRKTIKEGKEEIEFLAEYIFNFINT